MLKILLSLSMSPYISGSFSCGKRRIILRFGSVGYPIENKADKITYSRFSGFIVSVYNIDAFFKVQMLAAKASEGIDLYLCNNHSYCKTFRT